MFKGDLMPKITMVSEMLEEDLEYIGEQLHLYNRNAAPSTLRKHAIDVHLAIKDEEGHVYGGLIGKIYRFCLYIDTLWMDESIRGCGFGSQLIDEAERIARNEKCTFIHLDTFSFQAPEFYERKGFEVFGLLDGYPEGIKRYYLKKNL